MIPISATECVFEFTPAYEPQLYGPIQFGEMQEKTMRWGREILWAHTSAYIGKILYRRKDESYKGVMQYHVNKEETTLLLEGEALLRWDNGDGIEHRKIIYAPAVVHIPRYARHSIVAQTDCTFLEVSTPHFEDRVNVEERYSPDAPKVWEIDAERHEEQPCPEAYGA